jgi:hypothetical protein
VKFGADFVAQMDGRSALGKEVRSRIEAIEADLGGPDTLSHAQRSLVAHTVWIDLVLENEECRIASGQGIDIGPHTQLVNTLVGLYKTLGLKRQTRQVGLADYIQKGGSTPREGSP